LQPWPTIDAGLNTAIGFFPFKTRASKTALSNFYCNFNNFSQAAIAHPGAATHRDGSCRPRCCVSLVRKIGKMWQNGRILHGT